MPTSKPALDITHPEVAAQWHPTKNGDFKPGMFTYGSGQKFWWICKKKHEWETVINERTVGGGCPYCSNKKVGYGNDLKSKNPQLSKEWNQTKNGDLKPSQFTPFSHKKVWWICEKKHEWEAVISSRSVGVGCPYCANKKVGYGNDLGTHNPGLAKEWHPTKNNNLTPFGFTPSSGKRVWWACNNGHEWEAIIALRNRGTDCPYCTKQTSKAELYLYSELSGLFKKVSHREKLQGYEVDIFIEDLNIGVEYDGAFYHQNRLKHDKKKRQHLKENGIDIIGIREKPLPKIDKHDFSTKYTSDDFSLVYEFLSHLNKIGIPNRPHKKLIDEYLKKNSPQNEKFFKKLLSFYPKPLPGKSLKDYDSQLIKEWHPTKNDDLKPSGFTPFTHKKVWWICEKKHEWEAAINNRAQGRNCPYCSNKKIGYGNDLMTHNPVLAREWHSRKNGDLKPSGFSPRSKKKVWWICKEKHEWEDVISKRSTGKGCPRCKSLENRNPELAKEWHPTKNGDLEPSGIIPGSRKKVWWICEKKHEWKVAISHRGKGRNCPHCYQISRRSG